MREIDIKIKLSTALWCDLKTDRERAAWLLLGRGYETGVVCKSIQSDLAQAYSRLIERHECETCENKRKRLFEDIDKKVAPALRQALAEPDTGIDRGAWSDVPNATQWLDELRGDEPSTNAEPIGEIVEAHGLIAVSIPEMPPVGTKLYAQPLLKQTCCGCGQSGGYALYCGWCWSKFNKS